MLEEILVTARKVEESLQAAPVAVSAFTAEMLDDLSATGVGDVAGFTPNLTRTSGPTGGNDGFFFIRGVGQLDLNPAVDPGVATYLDGVYLGRIMGASFDTLDIARIEVLRGPQGTLFGRNTMGGAINVVTRDPGDDFGVKGTITGGSRDRIDGQFSMDVPVTDRFGVTLSGLTRNQDGWGKRDADGATFSDTETVAGRVKAVWDATDALTVRLSGDFTRSDGTPMHTVLLAYQPAPPLFPGGPGVTPLGVPFGRPGVPGEADLSPFVPGDATGFDLDDNNTDAPLDNVLEVWGGNATIDWDVAGMHIKSISSYRELEQLHANDFDGSPYHFFNGAFLTDQEQFSQELQFSGKFLDERVDWLAGFYYYTEEDLHTNRICLGTNLGFPVFIPPFGPLSFPAAQNDGRCIENNQRYSLDVDAWAVFTHVRFRITDQLSATAGFRYTDEEKDYRFNMFIDNTAGVFSFFGFPPIILPTLSPDNPFLGISPDASASWDDLTPKFGVEYQVTPYHLLYFSYSEGFKSGGFNGRPTPGPGGTFAPLTPFDPEQLETFEFGAKTEWFDHRVRLNIAGFLSSYDDIQLLVVNPATGFFDQENAAAADVNGVEVELMARPFERLDIMAGMGWMDAEYEKLEASSLASGIGFDDPLPMTPEWTFNVGAAYTFLLGELGTFRIRSDYSYTDDVCFQAACNTYDLQDGVGLLSIRGTFQSPDERLSLSVFGRNVTDEEYLSNAQDVIAGGLGVAFGNPAEPAEWGVELSYSWGYGN
jgi:iron complex outermembrane receptor protein